VGHREVEVQPRAETLAVTAGAGKAVAVVEVPVEMAAEAATVIGKV